MTYFVIIGKNKVYGTYHKTICAKNSFSNEEEKEAASNLTKAIVFNYAEGQVMVKLEIATDESIETDLDVFDFLDKKIK